MSPLRTLLVLAWPIVLSRATQSIMGFFDALMVAPFGEDALAAATTGAIDSLAIMILPLGTVFIVQSFAAQLKGKGELVAARRYAWYGLILAAASGVMALVALPFLPLAVGALGQTGAVKSLMTDYMFWRLPSLGAAVGMEVIGNWYGGMGDTKLQLRASVVSMISDMFLNWVLIYGHLGAPAMGVSGAALSSSIGSFIGLGYLLIAFHRDRTPGPLGLRMAELRRMLRFGLPNGLNWFLEFGAFLLFLNVFVPTLGTTVLAAFNVVMQVNSVSFMPAFGVGSAGAILVGQAVGAGQQDTVWPIVRRTMLVTIVWQVGVGLLYLLFPAVIIAWFTEPGDAGKLVGVGATMLAISAAWQLFDAIGITLSEALRAAGDTTWCLWARIIVAWVLFVPAAWLLLVRGAGGVPEMMLALVAYIAILAVAFAWRFRQGRWRAIDLTGIEPQLA